MTKDRVIFFPQSWSKIIFFSSITRTLLLLEKKDQPLPHPPPKHTLQIKNGPSLLLLDC